jgi:hypothetical protein
MLRKLLCGIYHNDKIYNVVNIEELTGKQQNYLTRFDELEEVKAKYKNNPEKLKEELGGISVHNHIPLILSDLVTDLQNSDGELYPGSTIEWIYKVPAEDILLCLIYIRIHTYGNKWSIPIICNKCESKQSIIIDLDTLEKKSISPNKITKKIKTPKSNQDIVIKIRGIKELLSIEKLFVEYKQEMFTKLAELSIVTLEDKAVNREILESLKVSDLDFIKENVEQLQNEIEIDTNIEHTCKECKEELLVPMPILDPNFFVQSLTPITGFQKNILPIELIS